MSFPRAPVSKMSFAIQVPVCVALALVVDYFGSGLFFGSSTFWDFAKTLGFAFLLFFGMRMMMSYYDAPLGCLFVVCLTVWMIHSYASAANATPGTEGLLMLISRPLWCLMLGSIASNALEVRWGPTQNAAPSANAKEGTNGSSE